MNPGSLQHALDRVIRASTQQWLLRAVATVAAAAAIGAAAVLVGWSATAFVVVVGLAALTSLWPDSHAPLIVDVTIVLSLVVAVDDLATPWLPFAAVCLLVHHAAIALAASIPIGGELPTSVLFRWGRNAAAVGAATVTLWFAVVVLDRRQLPGNLALSVLAFAIATGLMLAVRDRSVDAPR